jgi:hypothetical protein
MESAAEILFGASSGVTILQKSIKDAVPLRVVSKEHVVCTREAGQDWEHIFSGLRLNDTHYPLLDLAPPWELNTDINDNTRGKLLVMPVVLQRGIRLN